MEIAPMKDQTERAGAAIETVAKALGGHAICKPKYGRLSVEFPKLPDNPEHVEALYALAEIVEQHTENLKKFE